MTPAHARGGFFQLGYVTRDLGRAVDLYRSRYGVPEFLHLDTSRPDSGPGTKIAFAYKDGVMIELIEPVPGAEGIYADALRADDGVNLHHVGYVVENAASLAVIAAGYELDGIPVPVRFDNMLGFSGIYADTRPDVGHFSEYVFLHDEGRALFDRVPREVAA